MNAAHDTFAVGIAQILADKELIDPHDYEYEDLETLLSELTVGFC